AFTPADAVGLEVEEFAPFAESSPEEEDGQPAEEVSASVDEEESPFTFAEPETAFVPVVEAAPGSGSGADEEAAVAVESQDFATVEDLPDLEEPARPVKPKPKSASPQGELSFDGGPRGRFEGASPSLFEGEDL